MRRGPANAKQLIVVAMALAATASVVAPAPSSAAPLRPSVLCWNNTSPGYGVAGVRVKPKKCGLIRQGGFTTADTAYVISMHWKNWGLGRAKGSGIFAGNMGFRAPIKVQLKKPVTNCDGDLVFSKARFHSSDPDIRNAAMRLYTCPRQDARKGLAAAPVKPSTVYSVEGCLHAKPQPSMLVFACADAGLYIDGLTWSDWGGPSAHGSGTIHANTCDPYCLAGNFETAPVEVTLYNVQQSTCGKVSGLFYKNVRLSYPAGKPDAVGRDPRHVYCYAPSHPPNKTRHCGSSEGPGAGFFNVFSINIKCPAARHVARHVFKTGRRNFGGWHCKRTPAGVESERVGCGRDHRGRHQRVRFVIAA